MINQDRILTDHMLPPVKEHPIKAHFAALQRLLWEPRYLEATKYQGNGEISADYNKTSNDYQPVIKDWD